MKHLFSDWKRIEGRLKKSRRILLLLDYDGTLTPIVSRPKDAILDNRLRERLQALSKKKHRYSIGVISGRRVIDVKRLVGLPGIYYAGNHGLEIRGPGISFLHPSCKIYRRHLVRIKEELSLRTKGIKGVMVEYKGGSVSLHYRLVRAELVKRLKIIFDGICAPYVKKGTIRLSSGKKVWEVRLPIKWDKGKAVGKILGILRKRDAGIFPIYLGDDATDEDAFLFLRRIRSLTIFVGKKNMKTKAGYYLKSPQEVKRLLIKLCQV